MRYLALLAVSGVVFAQFHLPGTGGGKADSAPKSKSPAAVPAGDFEYYVLALSWTPGKRGPFLVRGLLPEKNEGAGPEACSSDRKVSRGAMGLALPLMESREAVQSEWEKHGSCSGLTVADYFNGMRYARSQVQLPVQLTSLEEPATMSPQQIEAAFAGANPGLPAGAFRVHCEGGKFNEARVCFDRQFKARECPAGAGACSAAEVTIQPR